MNGKNKRKNIKNKDIKTTNMDENNVKNDNVVTDKTSDQEVKLEENLSVEEAEQSAVENNQDSKNSVTENKQEGTTESEQQSEVTITNWESKYLEMNDRYLRLSAEFDNYRKRTLKEKMELVKTAGEDLLVALLPVVDNFERAMKSIENTKDIDAVKEGIHLIYGRFAEFLSQKGVKEIASQSLQLDTDLHEAVTKIPAPAEELKGKIVDVIEKGYYLHDKVIRYAKVVVGE